MLDGKTCFYNKIQSVAVFKSFFRKGITLFEAVADLKFFENILSEASFLEISKSDSQAFIRLKKVFGELARSIGCYDKEALTFILFLDFFGTPFLLDSLDMVFVSEIFKGFRICQMFMFHNKIDRIPDLSAAEAFEYLF